MLLRINSHGRSLIYLQTLDNYPENVELSFVDSMIEMWKLRCLIMCLKSELLAAKTLKKYKHLSEDFVYSRSSTWRSSALEKLMAPKKEERNCLHCEMASEQLLECYFLQYNNLMFNCKANFFL